MAYYNNHGDPRLRQGMTSNPSPVYTYMQPDRTGRRPTEYDMLQYARVEDIPHSPARADLYSNRRNQTAAPEAVTYAAQDQSSRQAIDHAARARHVTSLQPSGAQVRVISGGRYYTSTESETTQARSGRHPLVYSRVWFCCNPGCAHPGPYIFDIYANCVLGCGTPRCSDCTEEVIVTIDRDAPVRPREHNIH